MAPDEMDIICQEMLILNKEQTSKAAIFGGLSFSAMTSFEFFLETHGTR